MTTVLTFVSGSNSTNAGQTIKWFGANRQDDGEEAASITGKMTSNMGGSGNVQRGELSSSPRQELSVRLSMAMVVAVRIGKYRSSGRTPSYWCYAFRQGWHS